VAEDVDKINPHWATLAVKYDIRHFLGNFFLMAATKESALFKYFCVAVSEAVFKVDLSSRREVRDHLKYLGLSDDQIKRVRRKYWRRKARYIVPSPEVLVRDLTDVYEFFRPLVDPSTGRKFLILDHAKRFRQEMTYVRRGDLSDPPGMSMYISIGKYKSGLPRYFSLRSSSQLEGYHMHLNKVSTRDSLTMSNISLCFSTFLFAFDLALNVCRGSC